MADEVDDAVYSHSLSCLFSVGEYPETRSIPWATSTLPRSYGIAPSLLQSLSLICAQNGRFPIPNNFCL
ncbi:hypothetical protein DPMN_055878 [Dreissena polymorpha]|uniref:Uncharacterized protein n=1 Tax=Dreissena polymorpha TaxID=45954 RepID=A0A9D4CQQ8_DREPO|nr:hypothetical protein DPMN_055878 [Dreissena polymorpha]